MMKTILTFAIVAVTPNSKGCDSGEKDEGAPEKCGGTIEQDPPDNDGDFNP
ncbi:MAG: hypothetical protein WBL68_10020 [Nitrososphaeraceae archaeon]